MKYLEEEIVDNDEIINIVKGIKLLIREDRYNNGSIEDLKNNYPNKIVKLEEALNIYLRENDLKILKTELPDNKWKYLSEKLAYLYEYFKSIDDYRKVVDNLKKEDFSKKSKNDCPSEKEIERTEKFIRFFNIKNGEELTHLLLKSDVLLLASVFEKFIKVSINEFGVNPLYCVSSPGYTWQCGLEDTGKNLQTLQDKDSILTLENNKRGGISSKLKIDV